MRAWTASVAGRAVLVVLVMMSSHRALAEPAVDRANLRWMSGYDFEYTDDDQQDVWFGPGVVGVTFRPEQEVHSFSSRLILTFPIANRVGGRVRAAGGAGRIDEEVDVEFSRFHFRDENDYWSWNVDVGVDAFVRNPEIGYVEAGYSYLHEHVNRHPDTDQRSQVGTLGWGLYVTDVRIPPVDLDLRFVYERTSLHRKTRGTTWPIYRVEATTSVYLGEQIRVSLGGQYAYEDVAPLQGASIEDARALARLLWLLPIGGRSISYTVGLNGTVGELDERSSFGDFDDRLVTSIGFEIALLYPAGDSLVRLVRGRW